MPPRKGKGEQNPPKKRNISGNVSGLRAAVVDQPITDTLEQNYMPYAVSVIVSRAIPEIDGFKPSHRKLLYTMYKMGLLTGARTKSANIVGQTMRLNPHGDQTIYETMVRLSRGYEALLHPLVDSKGNFGKIYSRDMAYAASRYTEAKLESICQEIFGEIDLDTVDMVDNYDATAKEPLLLPTTFPHVLVSANQGIAVGMASMMCGFNLSEVCKSTIALMEDPEHDLLSTMPAPDFPTGGEIIYDPGAMREIYRIGRGSFRVRARWQYDKKENLIEILEIPYTTTVEAVIDKITDLSKTGKLREVSDIRDETDLGGLKLAIELKRGTDPEKLMQKLFKQTTLMDSFSCNFNILIGGMPRVLGVREIIDEWLAWRIETVRRRLYHDLMGKRRKLHLLEGLRKILLDIDRAIAIIRQTEQESEVVPNLMIGFGIDETQAEYVAEIRLRNINREYILKRVEETDSLKDEIADIQATLDARARIKALIIAELKRVDKKHGKERKTGLVYEHEVQHYREEEHIEDYPVHLFCSREGYFKKITPQSLRSSGEQKFKDGDALQWSAEAQNKDELLVFTSRQQAYKCRLHELEDGKASALGEYLPAKLGMEEGETVAFVCLPGDYSGNLLFFFENGKCARVELGAYTTVSNRRRLTGAYSGASPLVAALQVTQELELALFSNDGRALIFHTALITPKATRSVRGVGVLAAKGKRKLERAVPLDGAGITNPARYRARSLPAAGALLRPEDRGEEQMELE